MDNHKDKIPEGNNNLPIHDPINWKSLGFFSAEDYLLYVFKKVEKITAGLYLVSGLLKDEEPIKWELRDRGMDLMTSSFTASSSVPGDKNIVIQSLFTAALETISLLNVARISNLVSEMNHVLLVREIDMIITMLRDRLAANAENAGYVLSEEFFKTPSLFTSDFKGTGQRSISDPNAGRGNNQAQAKRTNSEIALSGKAADKGHIHAQEKKSQRQELIIGALRSRSNLTIKDFAGLIKDCSEKTIQRELLHLVDTGIVKKEGERRWSRYSLK